MKSINVCLGRLFALAMAVSVVLASSQVGAAEGDDNLTEPTTVVAKPIPPNAPTNTVDSPLTVLFGTVTIPTPAGDRTIDVRTYGLTRPDPTDPEKTEPMLPGPTFVFQPGDLLRLRFQNYLNRSQNPRLNQASSGSQGLGNSQFLGISGLDDIPEHVPHEISIPNNANLTNLHVHGLHVDPKQDNVTLLILPEDDDPSTLVPGLQRFVPTINAWWTRTYQYKLPADHLPGTHWYHAHKHGATSSQVENGMAGTLVIRPSNGQDIIPGFWDEATKTFSHDRVMILQELADFGTPQGAGMGKGSRAGGPATGPITTINGRVSPTLDLAPGQVERWRFVMAGANHTSACDVWVGKITPTLSAEMQTALEAIQSKADLDEYLPTTDASGTVTALPATMFRGAAATFAAKVMPGQIKLIAVDGVTIWQPRDVTPSKPAMGFSGNRFDLLIRYDSPQPAPKTTTPVTYRVYQNYPLLDDLASDYPELFGATVDVNVVNWRYQALTQGYMPESTITNRIPAANPVTDEASQQNLPPNKLSTDPYSLGSSYTGLSVNWAQVDEAGKPTGASPSTPIAPVILGKPNDATNGVDAYIPAQDPKNNPLLGWQPLGPSGAAENQSVLVELNITGTGSDVPAIPPHFEDVLRSYSPGGKDPENGTKLQRLNPVTGMMEPGIPAYVSPIKSVQGRQVVMFDKANFTFNYVNKPTAQTASIQQFWLNGRQFEVNDFQGNPDADQLISTPLHNVAPAVGSYSPGLGSWTHYVNKNIYITNPGYYVPVSSIAPGTASGFAYDDFKPLNNKAVTGLDLSTPPVATTAEEWLLVNNSDIVHPFHIHISPFFVTEIGQLNYDGTKASGSQWTFNKLTLTDMDNLNKPFSWVVGNWWDTIALPPHGYVKMKTWINVPSQSPASTSNAVDKNLKVVDTGLKVADNTNVYGSWVLHCHILRHEDRGMMTLVNAVPKLNSLGALPPAQPTDSALWTDDTGATHTITDVRGGLTITDVGTKNPPYPGTFHGGIGNPLFGQPWVGSMSPSTGGLTICVANDNQSMVLSNGHVWGRGREKPKPANTFVDKLPLSLAGSWTDKDGNNEVAITENDPKQKYDPANPATDPNTLTFTPVTPVWWRKGTGTWTRYTLVSTQVPTPIALDKVAYVGTQIVVNDAQQNQTLVFCVTGDLKKIVFGNGITWIKKPE